MFDLEEKGTQDSQQTQAGNYLTHLPSQVVSLRTLISVSLDMFLFFFYSEESLWSGWNALRGALEAGGPQLQGAYPSTYPQPTQSGIRTPDLLHPTADPSAA